MVAPANQLDEYERQLEALVAEVREYESTGKTLRDVAGSLATLQKTNSDVGRSINLTAANIARSLHLLEGLKLDEAEARNATNFQTQQQMLESLATSVREVVRAQQGLSDQLDGLGMAVQSRMGSLEKDLSKLLWLGIGFTVLVGILVLMLFIK